MRDFPPTFTTFLPEAEGEVATHPDTRSPGAFLRWHLGQQPGVIAAATFVGFLWQLPLTLGPWLVGKVVDEGILSGSSSDLLRWAGLLGLVTVIGAVFGIAMHTLVVRSWLIALYGTIQMVARKSVQMGHVLPRMLLEAHGRRKARCDRPLWKGEAGASPRGQPALIWSRIVLRTQRLYWSSDQSRSMTRLL